MRNFITVCRNVIAANNKRDWVNPSPSIRVSNSKTGKATKRGHKISIKDDQGNEVARIVSTTDGKPVLKCGAKVAIITEHEVEILE